jgi:DNA gyrase subunit B
MDNIKKNEYGESSIKVLEGLEAVRKRPAMYIGDTGERGLHHLINEVVDNSIDEALAGHCKNIKITLHADGGCSVSDDGRGIPVGMHPQKKISTLELVMCTLHAGGKFDKDTYKVSGGLHGVGVSCVNALSSDVYVEVNRDGKKFRQEYQKGKPVTKVSEIGTSRKSGTFTYFKPDDTIFKVTKFRFDKTADRLRELAFLNPQVKIELNDERDGEQEFFHFPGGLKDFVKYVDDGTSTYVKPVYFDGEENDDNDALTQVEVCFQYNDGYSENVLSYVNNIHTLEGGTHVTGFRAALTRSFNTYANNAAGKKTKVPLSGDDFKEGLTAIISVKVAEPQFEGQTKTKLGNSDVERIVRNIVSDKLAIFLDSNPAAAKKIISKAVLAAEARMAAKKSRELVRRKNALESSALPGKLADCSLNTPEDTEIYIVEGDSAGGSAKQGRDRKFQAILPLRGKILNVQKARIHKVLENQEVRTMISALGAGFDEDFDAEKTRYHKIILMADADVDGSHIRTLILTLFFKYMRELIVKGYLYIAQPPLYKIKKGKKEFYAYNEDEKLNVIDRIRKEDLANISLEDISEEQLKKQGISIQRFKGLGEMNPDQLWETTMNPETRTLLQVSLGEAAEASRVFQTLMGDKVEPRREFIEKNAKYVKNLDI